MSLFHIFCCCCLYILVMIMFLIYFLSTSSLCTHSFLICELTLISLSWNNSLSPFIALWHVLSVVAVLYISTDYRLNFWSFVMLFTIITSSEISIVSLVLLINYYVGAVASVVCFFFLISHFPFSAWWYAFTAVADLDFYWFQVLYRP